jgi:uncharacterized protein YutE (UPF0331/DUF86 family)
VSKEELLAALARDVADLDRYAREITYDSFVRDRDTQNMVLFAVYRVAQDLIDLANFVVAERGLGVPRTYREALQLLAQSDLLDASLASQAEGWVGLRNVIAHIYRKLDLDLVFRAVTEERGPLHEVLRRMGELIRAQ